MTKEIGEREHIPVVTGTNLAQLVGAYTFHRLVVRLGVVLNRNLGGHATHGVDATLVASLDQELDLYRRENIKLALHSEEQF